MTEQLELKIEKEIPKLILNSISKEKLPKVKRREDEILYGLVNHYYDSKIKEMEKTGSVDDDTKSFVYEQVTKYFKGKGLYWQIKDYITAFQKVPVLPHKWR